MSTHFGLFLQLFALFLFYKNLFEFICEILLTDKKKHVILLTYRSNFTGKQYLGDIQGNENQFFYL